MIKIESILIGMGTSLVLTFFFLGSHMQDKNLTLTMPTYISQFSDDLRPEHVDFIEQYTFLNALFSPLVLFDNSGRIESNLATGFYWSDEHTLVFEFEREYKTKDGHSIGPDDALYSIKRMIILGNMHGSLADRLEIPQSFKGIDDVLPSLYVKSGKLHIKLKGRDQAVLHILASADFAIIPRVSIDPKTLNITNLRNTSGPYYLAFEDGEKAILEQNEGHFRIQSGNPKKIVCLKFNPSTDDAFEAYKKGLIDHIPTGFPLGAQQFLELSSTTPSTLHKTRDIKLSFASFTERGRQRFPPEVRALISITIQKAIHQAIRSIIPNANPTRQFFHEDGVGSIAAEEIERQLQGLANKAVAIGINSRSIDLEIDTFPIIAKRIEPILKDHFRSLKVNTISKSLGVIEKSKSDMLFSAIDVGLKEDYTGISFAMEMGIFPLSREDARIWLQNLSLTNESHRRLLAIESIHLKAVATDPTIVPLYRLPFYAFSRNGWKMNLPTLWVTERFWQIFKED